MSLPDARVVVVALVTFAIVMTGMIVLALAASLLRRAGTRLAGQGPAPAAVDPALLAVITAAASEAIGQPVAVHTLHVRRAPEVDRWSRAGRMDVMVSHRVGPRR